jgi:hypothetical protein
VRSPGALGPEPGIPLADVSRAQIACGFNAAPTTLVLGFVRDAARVARPATGDGAIECPPPSARAQPPLGPCNDIFEHAPMEVGTQ